MCLFIWRQKEKIGYSSEDCNDCPDAGSSGLHLGIPCKIDAVVHWNYQRQVRRINVRS